MPLPTVEQETGAQPTHAIIWLHGLGADGNDFAPIVPELVDDAWPALRFVFPHAPVRPVTVNNGIPMRAWYDIKGLALADKQDAEGIRASVGEVEALIAREIERGIPASRIVLAGFSQGGAIALAAGLRHTATLAGIVALSTYVPMHETVEAERHGANHETPIFWGHGTADPIVPIALGTLSRDTLVALGHQVDWHTYPMGHQVSLQEIADLRVWLGKRLTNG
ncbi:phospholipase/carboxylesterase [Luteibacter rhizovicinus]|uniref:Phospholipase/carboxylesterase n=1 Tax=Luteibacter rhizovicinus TaxID=242606 RepID=A0A4R3YPG2_9GAMM|nr:alpha/beta hydrolase fold domain-containing protein [Luteibacter rhizovicinus]TCV92803.1 phospholipase/carboxylesterase [Luteibacter rhizovicinus]